MQMKNGFHALLCDKQQQFDQQFIRIDDVLDLDLPAK